MADIDFEEVQLGTAPTGVGGDVPRTAFGKIIRNFNKIKAFFADSSNAASRKVGTGAGQIVPAGTEGGLFGRARLIKNADDVPSACIILDGPGDGSSGYPGAPNDPILLIKGRDTSRSGGIQFSSNGLRFWGTAGERGHLEGELRIAWHSGNTTTDPNGFIKSASPIIKLFNDKIEKTNHLEIQPASLEKLGTGKYKLTGVPKLSRDGWYIETPKDRNNNIYFTLDYEENNGELIIKTYEPDYSSGKAENGAPVDILEGRFVSLRFAENPELYPEPEDE